MAAKWQQLEGEQVDIGHADRSAWTKLVTVVNVKFKQAQGLNQARSCSQGEGKVDKANENEERQKIYLEFCQKHLLRTYPGAKRMDSSNYDPTHAWQLGAQIVALNWQSYAAPMWTYHARFTENGGCGYVLKPQWQRQPNPLAPYNVPKSKALKVTVLGARGMMTRLDHYAIVSLHGLGQDEQVAHTSVITARNFVTYDETFRFTISCVDSAVLTFVLMDRDFGNADDFTGQCGISLASMNEGTWCIPCKNHKGQPFNGRKARMEMIVKLQWDQLTEAEKEQDPPKTEKLHRRQKTRKVASLETQDATNIADKQYEKEMKVREAARRHTMKDEELISFRAQAVGRLVETEAKQ